MCQLVYRGFRIYLQISSTFLKVLFNKLLKCVSYLSMSFVISKEKDPFLGDTFKDYASVDKIATWEIVQNHQSSIYSTIVDISCRHIQRWKCFWWHILSIFLVSRISSSLSFSFRKWAVTGKSAPIRWRISVVCVGVTTPTAELWKEPSPVCPRKLVSYFPLSWSVDLQYFT